MIRNLAWFVLYLIAVMGVLALFWFGAAIILAPMVELNVALLVAGLAVFCVVALATAIQRGTLK
jgi:hypothetical protein